MTNYMYHQNKESHTDLDTIDSQMWQRYENITMDDYWEGKIFYNNDSMSDNYLADKNIIQSICNKYKMFGDYSNVVLYELNKLGIYELPVKKDNSFNYNNFIKNSIIGEILYTMLRKI